MTLDNARLARENLRIRLTNERQMMANEVHDSLAQGLTYMRMRMSLLRDAIRDNDELRALKYWSDVDDTLGNSQRRLRELITYFRSRMDPQGLVHALRETSERFLDRTGIALSFVNQVPTSACRPNARSRSSTSCRRRSPTSARHAHATSARAVAGLHARTATDRRRGRRRRLRRRRGRAEPRRFRATTGSRSCASAPAASAGPSPWGGPAGPARGSNSRFPLHPPTDETPQ